MKRLIKFPKGVMNIDKQHLSIIVAAALSEDLHNIGDITTDNLLSEKKQAKANLIAKENGIVCGIDCLIETYNQLDRNIHIEIFKKDGDYIESKDKILSIEGSSHLITKGERVALNFLGFLSGISTQTHKYVKVLNNNKIKIIDTRKTIPGLRDLQKYAVVMGGGFNHRMGLFDMVLIKENHISAFGSIRGAIDTLRAKLPETIIECEVETLEQIKDIIDSDVDIIMLDNFDNNKIEEAIKIINNEKYIEVSGNINEKRLLELRNYNIDFISVGALTHTIKPLDISLLIE